MIVTNKYIATFESGITTLYVKWCIREDHRDVTNVCCCLHDLYDYSHIRTTLVQFSSVTKVRFEGRTSSICQ